MKKILSIAAAAVLSLSILAGCSKPAATTPSPTTTDAVTAASLTKDPAVFAKSVGKDGKWIIAITENVTVTKDLVLEGEFKNGKKDTAGKELIQRKIALYTQDANRKVIDRFTLTAPKITIKSPVATIEHGIFKGDIYVETNDFKLIDTKVTGNVYFISEAAKAGFRMDADSSISGKNEVKK